MTDEELKRDQKLIIWTIYDHPLDFPDSYVARKWRLNVPTDEIKISDSLDKLRDAFEKQGLYRLERFPDDDLKIVEIWL